MTSFGKFACASVAALTLSSTTPAFAGSTHDQPIHVFCDGIALAPFCAALVKAVNAAQTSRKAVVAPDPSPAVVPSLFTIRFEPTRQGDHLLSGFLSWRSPSGETGKGPEIELSVMDAAINREMLDDYARQLVQHSSIPL